MESAKRNHEAVPAFRCNTIVVICYQLVSFILSKFGRCLNGLLADDELCTVIFFPAMSVSGKCLSLSGGDAILERADLIQ